MPTPSGHTTAIRATRVIGTAVHTGSGDALGSVEDVVLDKTSDRVMFAVISVGGALTSTRHYYPVPWSVLDYDAAQDAYVVPYTRDDLASHPAVSILSDLTESDGAQGREGADGGPPKSTSR